MVFHLRISLALLTLFFVSGISNAQTQTRITVEEPVTHANDFYRVAAHKTHSGLPVPRFVSLKFSKVNGRQGPSLQHPILWQYQRKGLPLIVIAEMDVWRKVRDIDGDESWVRGHALTKVNRSIAARPLKIFRKPNPNASVIAEVEPYAIMELGDCRDDLWCKVKSDSGLKGWAHRATLWGAGPL